ncbi:S1C family serine protease [Cryobacterium soli]|uniref:S1C family serine protease n=1 Tax=Cryobacterium soli TaxID=2220095 RepID=UPI000E70DB54|nr:trypsin-like peptidase domain-containing protein [Cryobacterium soli]
MTDSTENSGNTPDQPDQPNNATPIEVNSTGEAVTGHPTVSNVPNDNSTPQATAPLPPAPAADATSHNTAATAAGGTPDNSAHSAAAASAVAHSAATHPAAAHQSHQPHQAQQTQPTQPYGQPAAYPAYPTDAFGRPIPGPDGSTPIYAPTPAQQQAYANGAGYPAQPISGAKPPKDPNRRKGSMALVAALAIGALVGGASGAGASAYFYSTQTNGTPASQAQGPSTVVVNNTDSVNEITAVAAKASPSVVTIEVASGESGGTGSGVILSKDGYVLTNTHVVTLDGAAADAKIQVKSSDGKLYSATLIGTDPVSDLAVIKLDDAKDLTPITWADSSDLNVGDTAIAIGAPLGLSGTVTNGIVSALNRSITVASSAAPTTPDETTPDGGDGNYFNYDLPGNTPDNQAAQSSISLSVIQTDAAINPGNSGGALLNSKGELIGINVAIANAGGSSSSSAAGSIGVGFSIPANLAKRVSTEIIDSGSASHGLLGASVTSATSTDSATVGALISEVSSGGAAQKAGLKAGDVVTNFNGVPITDATDLTAQVRTLAAGDTADLTYVRDGQSVTVSVTVGELTS